MCITQSSIETGEAISIPTQFAVSIVMERRVVSRSGWSVPQWQLHGVLADYSDAPASQAPEEIRSDEKGKYFLWSGFFFSLYKDSAEQYWHSLMGREPALYVVCREDEYRELSPYLVTIDYDEASAYVEADDKVFSAPIPAEIYPSLAVFVMEYYQPKEKKVRKRQVWKEGGHGGEAFAHRPRSTD